MFRERVSYKTVAYKKGKKAHCTTFYLKIADTIEYKVAQGSHELQKRDNYTSGNWLVSLVVKRFYCIRG